MTLVVHVDSADIMATLLILKRDFEHHTGKVLYLTFAEATEAHLLAEEIAEAKVSVILSPSKPYPTTWDQRRLCVLVIPLPLSLRKFVNWLEILQAPGPSTVLR